MTTFPLQPSEFAAKFGTDKVKEEGNYEYYATDTGLGIIKDLDHGSLEFVNRDKVDNIDLSPDEELELISTITAKFKKDVEIPSSYTKSIEEYEYEEQKSGRGFKAALITAGTIITICLVVYIYVVYGNK